MRRPGEYDITIYQNAVFELPLTRKVDDVPVPMPDAVGRMQVRMHPGADVLLDLSSEAPGAEDTFIQAITIGASDGTIVISLSKEQTATLDVHGWARYDLLIDDVRLLEGRLRVSEGITIS